MKKIKKNQHYVWRYYLKPWTLNDKIWCKRGNQIFNSSLKNIGTETYFYETKKLNKIEIKFILRIIDKFPVENHKVLLDIFKLYLENSGYSDVSRKTGLENYHSFLENNAVDIFNQLYKHDLAFLNTTFLRANFSYFVGLQYTRTKKMFEMSQLGLRSIPAPVDIDGKFDYKTISRIMGLIIAESIGNFIHSKCNFCFLKSSSELITCDQPVINLRYTDMKFQPKYFELYYPLTPNLALCISEKRNHDLCLKEEDTWFFNAHMTRNSFEQIYSKSPNLLNIK